MGATTVPANTRVPQEVHCFAFHGHDTLLRRSLKDESGKWSGFNAPIISERQTPRGAAIELFVQHRVRPTRLDYHGNVTYKIGGATAKVMHLFSARGWRGEPVMSPHFEAGWFGKLGLPQDQMEHDILMWLNHARDGRVLKCTIVTEPPVVTASPPIAVPTSIMGSIGRSIPKNSQSMWLTTSTPSTELEPNLLRRFFGKFY